MHTYIKHIPRCKQVLGGMPLKKGMQLAASGSSSCMHPSRMDGSIPCMMEACIVAWHMGWKYVSFFLFFCYRHSFQDLLTVCKQVDGKRPMTNAIDRHAWMDPFHA